MHLPVYMCGWVGGSPVPNLGDAPFPLLHRYNISVHSRGDNAGKKRNFGEEALGTLK